MQQEQLNKYLINHNATILEALGALNGLSNAGLTLFVQDENKHVIGALTDGDIRRYLLNGGNLQDDVLKAVKADFCSIRVETNDFVKACNKYRQSKIRVVPIIDKNGKLVDILDFDKQASILPIDAVIMAGGKGERLRPLTEKTPKPLLPVGDKAIIDHNVDRLIQYGVEHISVTTNYLAEQLESHYAQTRNEVQIQCVREPKFLGTMGAVRLVKEFHNDVILVMNSDLFTDIDFEDMYLHFIENKADMSIAAIPYTVSIPFGICDLDGRNVKCIVEKPTYNYYANAGIYMLRREVINMIPENEFYNATDLIDALVKNGSKVIRYPLKGTWIDIGTLSEYQKAKDLAKHMK